MFKYSSNKEWFEVIKYKDYLYIIRERLDEIDPRFYTTYSNLYLILGSHSALLIDTGSGLYPLKPIVDDLILDRKLKVINTHSHFDHIGGNHEFEKIHIHKKEQYKILKPRNISFLKDSSKEITKLFRNKNYALPPAKDIHLVKDKEIIDLGDISIEVIHTPGHSSGSICLFTNRKELFTGDTAHYGTMYLPKMKIPIFLSSISKLLKLIQNLEDIEIFPSHEEFAVSKNLLIYLRKGINEIDKIWDTKTRDDFLEGWLLSDENFKYLIL
ncbi:MAG: MBL fold metallo-hydrolase [Candidatus Odinarchaeota archaeon]